MNTASTYKAEGLSMWAASITGSLLAAQFVLPQDVLRWHPEQPTRAAGISASIESTLAAAEIRDHLKKRVVELLGLKENWDGEGGKPVKRHVLADALQLIKDLERGANGAQEVFLAPTPGGFVQLEWHRRKRFLDVEATINGWSVVGATADEQPRGYFTTECGRSDFNRVRRFYSWLIGDELIWPSQ